MECKNLYKIWFRTFYEDARAMLYFAWKNDYEEFFGAIFGGMGFVIVYELSTVLVYITKIDSVNLNIN